MTFSAKIICDSIGQDAPRLAAIELVYPRFIHSELLTHRVTSKNSSSSRAIPFVKMLADIKADIAKPAEWRMDEGGMQGFTVAPVAIASQADRLWMSGMFAAAQVAEQMHRLGLHKQHVNRVMEPYAHMRVIMSSTQWKNLLGLRNHRDADPSICLLAQHIQKAMDESMPTVLTSGEWHLPYVTGDAEAIQTCTEFAEKASVLDLDRWHIRSDDRKLTAIEVMKRVSAARCARTSYKTFDGKTSTVTADFALFDKLVGGELLHASPTEHQASPDRFLITNRRWMSPRMHGNFNGWCQFRKELPNENLDVVIGEEF